MLGWLRQLGARTVETISLRRWEGARTDRLNKAHWAGAQGQTINEDLAEHRETLVNRALYENGSNGFVEGVIGTHVTDVVGQCGPSLQVHSSSDAYNAALEAAWSDWWMMPDAAGVLSGVDLLQQWDRLLWTCGEFLFQLVNGDGGPTRTHERIKLRINNIHPRRLQDPLAGAPLDGSVVMGVKRDKTTGRPLAYFITDFPADEGMLGARLEPREIDAREIVHAFRAVEPGQARGIPLLAPTLQVIADLRDYDVQVLDAARAAADFAVLLFTEHPDAPFISVNESVQVKRRTMSTAPPGWKAEQLKPNQPATNYIDYRAERLRELGRPVGMPLMMVRLDSAKHNYSSARLDHQIYYRGIRALQGWLERVALHRLLGALSREAELAQLVPARPDDVRYTWIWPVPPHVDPTKESTAAETRLRIGISTVTQELEATGGNLESHLAIKKRELAEFAAAGVPYPQLQPAPQAAAGGGPPRDPDDEDREEEDDEDQGGDRGDAAAARPFDRRARADAALARAAL